MAGLLKRESSSINNDNFAGCCHFVDHFDHFLWETVIISYLIDYEIRGKEGSVKRREEEKGGRGLCEGRVSNCGCAWGNVCV